MRRGRASEPAGESRLVDTGNLKRCSMDLGSEGPGVARDPHPEACVRRERYKWGRGGALPPPCGPEEAASQDSKQPSTSH